MKVGQTSRSRSLGNFFYLVTLTLKFDLFLKKFNLDHNFLTGRGRVFTLHMYISCDKTFPWVPKYLPSDLNLEV